MYQIGLFSKINQVTIKTLHHYDEIDLFKPAKIDKKTGYRYYELGQAYELHKITSLKQMGFSLDEIKEYLINDDYEGLLNKKRMEIQIQIKQKENSIKQIDYYLSNNNNTNNYSVIVKTLPEIKVAYMKKNLTCYQELFNLMPILGDKMNKIGCVCAMPPYCFNIYLNGEYRETNIDVELCESIVDLKEDQLGVSFKIVPEVKKAACLFHKGSYDLFPNAYLALIKWMEDNNYQPDGLPRESYIDGIWNKNDVSEWLTEIQFPIK